MRGILTNWPLLVPKAVGMTLLRDDPSEYSLNPKTPRP